MKKICNCCGKIMNDSSYLVDGVYLCGDCFNDRYDICDGCGRFIPCDDMFFFDDAPLCDVCYDEYVGRCSLCNEEFWRDELREICGLVVCNSCRDNDFVICDVCGEYVYIDEAFYDDYNGRYLCESCHDEYYMEYKDWYDTIVDVEKLKPTDTFNVFGVEVEALIDEALIDNSDFDYENDAVRYFTTVEDASLSDGGLEFVSVPLPNPSGFKIIHDFSKKYANNRLSIDTSCGLHVHLYINPILVSVDNLKRLFAGYYIMENLFFSMMPSSRRDNNYCKKLSCDYNLNTMLNVDGFLDFVSLYYDKGIYSVNEIPKEKYSDKRYFWVNFNSIFYRNTIEIRLHNGTTNSKKIVYWVMINQRFLRWLFSHSLDYIVNNLNKDVFLYEIMNKKLRRYIFGRIGKFDNSSRCCIGDIDFSMSGFFCNVLDGGDSCV